MVVGSCCHLAPLNRLRRLTDSPPLLSPTRAQFSTTSGVSTLLSAPEQTIPKISLASNSPLLASTAGSSTSSPSPPSSSLESRLSPSHCHVNSRCLEMFDIPVPRYALVNRESHYQEVDYFVEEEDFIEVHGERFWKPFVEKPVHGDEHSIMTYYPSAAGGGMKELFRKVGNRSSEVHPEVRRVRREGSYIYEEFMPTGGTNVKVYIVGPEYAHAEARKSPVVDGVVMRNHDGKEHDLVVGSSMGSSDLFFTKKVLFRQCTMNFRH